MIEQAVEELTPLVGTYPACRAVGAAPATIYRHRRPPEPRPRKPRPKPARALSAPERDAVLEELHSERFVDRSPAQVWATLLDEGRYLVRLRARPNTKLLLTGNAPGCVSNRIRWVSIGLRLVVRVCFLAELPAGPVRLAGRCGSRIPIR
jgi:hypothetical protein